MRPTNTFYVINNVTYLYSLAKSEVECQGNLFDLRNEENDTPVDIDP